MMLLGIGALDDSKVQAEIEFRIDELDVALAADAAFLRGVGNAGEEVEGVCT